MTVSLCGSLFLQLIIQSGSKIVKVQTINQPCRSQQNYFHSGKTLVILHLIPTLKRNTLIGRDLKQIDLAAGLQIKLELFSNFISCMILNCCCYVAYRPINVLQFETLQHTGKYSEVRQDTTTPHTSSLEITSSGIDPLTMQ